MKTKLKIKLVHFDVVGGYCNSLALGYLRSYFLRYPEFNSQCDFTLLNLPIRANLSTAVNRYLTNILSNNPDVIGFNTYMWSIELVLKVSELIKAVYPQTRLILGGTEVSSNPESILENYPFIDAIVLGEGEKTFFELIKLYLEYGISSKPEGIKGLVYKKNNNYSVNDERNEIKNLDEIPSPFLSQVLKGNSDMVLFETSRGCLFNCSYCNWSPRRMRYFSMSRLTQELDYIFCSMNYRHLFFIDSSININIQRGKQILQCLIAFAQKYDLKNHKGLIQFYTQIETIDEEYLENYYELGKLANIIPITLPFQTQNQDARTASQIHPNSELVNEKFQMVKKFKRSHNFPAVSYALIGIEEDNLIGFKHTISELWECTKNDVINDYSVFNVSVPRGSSMFSHRKETKLISGSSYPYHFIQSSSIPVSDWIKMQKISTADISLRNILSQKKYNKHISRHKNGLGVFRKTIGNVYSLCTQIETFDIVNFLEELGELIVDQLFSHQYYDGIIVEENSIQAVQDFCKTILVHNKLDKWICQIDELAEIESVLNNQKYDIREKKHRVLEISELTKLLYEHDFNEQPLVFNSRSALSKLKAYCYSGEIDFA